jgi:hypothetical protein
MIRGTIVCSLVLEKDLANMNAVINAKSARTGTCHAKL